MKILSLIPARMGSSRFPGKPMKKILGKPMIGHVYEQVSKCNLLDFTAVATCDDEIYNYIESIGGNAVMTKDIYERASDRCSEALLSLEQEHGFNYDIVVMVQGDEPMTKPEMIDEAVKPMINDNSIDIVNLIADISSEKEFEDPNCIKVVTDINNNALYFSREPIPTRSKSNIVSMRKQVCIIPFRRDFLFQYGEWEPTPLEIDESVDMMRVLENGYKVKMIPTKFDTKAVDTIQDLEDVENLMKNQSF